MTIKKTLLTLLMSLPFVSAIAKPSKVEAPRPVVVMETSEGAIKIMLMPEIAPLACENMTLLAKEHYYDGLIFHRIIPGFMLQGGDPEGTGMGGASFKGKPFEGKPFKDEFSKEVRFDRPGLLAMANSGPNTNGSQFFITTIETPHLDEHHTIFGEVIEGYEVVKKIEKEGSRSGTPKKRITISRLYIETPN